MKTQAVAMSSMMAMAQASVSYGPTDVQGTDYIPQTYGPVPVDNGTVGTTPPDVGYSAPSCDIYDPSLDCYDPCQAVGDCPAPPPDYVPVPDCDDSDDDEWNDCPIPVEPCQPGFISIGGPCIPDPSLDPYVQDVATVDPFQPYTPWDQFTQPEWVYNPQCDKKYGVDHYVESYQKDCGILLIDIVKYICDYWFKDIDPTIYDQFVQHIDTVYDVSTNVDNTPAAITDLVNTFTPVTDFCNSTPVISDDHDLYGIIKLCAEACVNMYKRPVSQDVYDAWYHLKDGCVDNNSWDDLEYLLYALAKWLKDDLTDFHPYMQHLLDSDVVGGYAADVQNAIGFSLQSVDDDVPSVDTNSASTLMVSVGAVATAVLALIM